MGEKERIGKKNWEGRSRERSNMKKKGERQGTRYMGKEKERAVRMDKKRERSKKQETQGR